MQIPLKLALILIVFISALVGIGAYFYAKNTIPAKVEVQEKVVVKEVEVIKKDVRVVERVVERPDGTIESERIIEDKTQSETQKDHIAEAKTQIKNQKKLEIGYIGGINLYNTKNMLNLDHGLYVKKEIIGNVSVGIYGQNGGSVGIMIGVDF